MFYEFSLIKFSTYFLYSCVHISVYYLVDRFKEPPIKAIICGAFISFGVSILIGDAITRFLLTIFGLSLNHYFYLRSRRSAHPSEACPKKLILVTMYGIYSLMILVEILLYDSENFLTFPMVYNVLLLICLFNLKVDVNIAYARLFDNTSKLLIIFTFLLFAIVSADLPMQLMCLLAAIIFTYFYYRTNQWEFRFSKIDSKRLKKGRF